MFSGHLSKPYWEPDLLKSSMPGICFGSTTEHPVWNNYQVKALSELIFTTQLLLLDVDECHVHLDRIQAYLDSALGCWNIWYTTPKSTPLHPRFRLLLCANRPITMGEKRALSKPLREKIPGIDQASFEPSKFCLFPCICADSADPDSYTFGCSKLTNPFDINTVQLEVRNPVHSPSCRVELTRLTERLLDDLVTSINEAPDGCSQPVIKTGLSHLLRHTAVPMDVLELKAEGIERDDRRRDFIGIARWMQTKQNISK